MSVSPSRFEGRVQRPARADQETQQHFDKRSRNSKAPVLGRRQQFRSTLGGHAIREDRVHLYAERRHLQNAKLRVNISTPPFEASYAASPTIEGWRLSTEPMLMIFPPRRYSIIRRAAAWDRKARPTRFTRSTRSKNSGAASSIRIQGKSRRC